MKRCVILAADPDRAAAIAASVPAEVYEIVSNDQTATADLLLLDANGATVWFTRLRPLSAVSDQLDDAVAQYLREHGILEVADLPRLNLDQLAAAVGPRALQRFVRDLAHSGRYPNGDFLQEFIVRRGIFI